MDVGLASISGQAMAQWAAIMNIPGRVFANWPSFFSFGLIDYAIAMVISVTPLVEGTPGIILNAALGGFRDTSKAVTWEAVKQA